MIKALFGALLWAFSNLPLDSGLNLGTCDIDYVVVKMKFMNHGPDNYLGIIDDYYYYYYSSSSSIGLVGIHDDATLDWKMSCQATHDEPRIITLASSYGYEYYLTHHNLQLVLDRYGDTDPTLWTYKNFKLTTDIGNVTYELAIQDSFATLVELNESSNANAIQIYSSPFKIVVQSLNSNESKYYLYSDSWNGVNASTYFNNTDVYLWFADCAFIKPMMYPWRSLSYDINYSSKDWSPVSLSYTLIKRQQPLKFALKLGHLVAVNGPFLLQLFGHLDLIFSSNGVVDAVIVASQGTEKSRASLELAPFRLFLFNAYGMQVIGANLDGHGAFYGSFAAPGHSQELYASPRPVPENFMAIFNSNGSVLEVSGTSNFSYCFGSYLLGHHGVNEMYFDLGYYPTALLSVGNKGLGYQSFRDFHGVWSEWGAWSEGCNSYDQCKDDYLSLVERNKTCLEDLEPKCRNGPIIESRPCTLQNCSSIYTSLPNCARWGHIDYSTCPSFSSDFGTCYYSKFDPNLYQFWVFHASSSICHYCPSIQANYTFVQSRNTIIGTHTCGWSEWTILTENCTQTRSRRCLELFDQESSCAGNSTEILKYWQEWTEWSNCSLICSNQSEFRNRTRSCLIANLGESEFEECNLNTCPPSTVNLGQWGSWSTFSSCSSNCGPGTQMRNRTCDGLQKNLTCTGNDTEIQACDAICTTSGVPLNFWSSWSPWSICFDNCTIMRNRNCLSLNPLLDCGTSSDFEIEECFTNKKCYSKTFLTSQFESNCHNQGYDTNQIALMTI